ncbi:MAG: YfiR family protein [Cyclobacteriaceae bacterium]|nr:YfiR family protein [Cyclobacteriaceae bacterium]
MRSFRSIFIISALLFYGSLSVLAQKAKHQGEIIYKLSQHITWPEKADQHKFVIGVMGSANDFYSFQQLAMEKSKISGMLIEVRYYECATAVSECQMLYISQECKIKITDIVKQTKKKPILIVSARLGYGALGAIINFVEYEGKLKFELNEAQAAKRGLTISDQLRDLAVVI